MASKSEQRLEIRKRQKAWLEWACKKKNVDIRTLGTKAGTSSETLARMFYETYKGALTAPIIQQVVDYWNIPDPDEYMKVPTVAADDAAEAVPYGPKKDNPVIEAMLSVHRGAEAWMVLGNALDARGYHPGDVVAVDRLASPRNEDIVLVEIEGRFAFRVFHSAGFGAPAFLMPHSATSYIYPPEIVDGKRVAVRGVALDSYRPLRVGRAA